MTTIASGMDVASTMQTVVDAASTMQTVVDAASTMQTVVDEISTIQELSTMQTVVDEAQLKKAEQEKETEILRQEFLRKKAAGPPKVAIVTITIGSQRWRYERNFIPSIKAYADKWKFDYIQIKEMLDLSIVPRSDTHFMKQVVCMQKCLIASQPWAQNYDIIIYMDADILVNLEKAPNIIEEYLPGKIAAVDERNMFGNAAYVSHVWKQVAPQLPKTALEYYFKFFPGQEVFPRQFNGGLLIFQPKVHVDFFKMVYDKYMPMILAGKDLDGDQAPLNYEANKANLVQYIDERWNRLWNFCWKLYYGFLDEKEHKDILRLCLRQIFDMHYFIHFAGGCGWSLL